MGDKISFGLQRADEKGDCRLCNAVDVLEELLEEIKSGKIMMPEMMYIALRIKNPDDPDLINYNHRCCGGNNIELVGLVSIHHHRLCMPDNFD